MKPALQYIFEMLVCSGIFLAAYRLLLANTRHYGRLRAYILACTLLSAVVPLTDIPVYPPETVFIEIPVSMPQSGNVSTAETASEQGITDTPQARASAPGANKAAAAAYLSVTAILATGILLKLGRIRTTRRQSHITIKGKGRDRYYIAENPRVKSPFSFMNTIYIGTGLEPIEKEIIIAHEHSHIRHRHSCERLLMSALTTIFWFNPFIWISGRQLEEVQELEADRDVLSQGYDTRLYRLTIFKQLFGYYPEISCGLKNSLTKRRFIMMTEKEKPRFTAIRWMAATMLVAGTSFMLSATAATETSGPDMAVTHTAVQDNTQKVLTISADGSEITVNGDTEASFSDLTIKADLVIIKATDDTPMETINGIRQVLRATGNLKIEYATAEESSKPVRKFLPPKTTGNDDPQIAEIVNIRADNSLAIKIDSKGKTLVTTAEGKKEPGRHSLTDMVAKAIKKTPGIFILLETEDNTPYGAYYSALSEINKAYTTVRNGFATARFGKSLDSLSEKELAEVKKEIPVRVSETYGM